MTTAPIKYSDCQSLLSIQASGYQLVKHLCTIDMDGILFGGKLTSYRPIITAICVPPSLSILSGLLKNVLTRREMATGG
jgi:hypothetical protein